MKTLKIIATMFAVSLSATAVEAADVTNRSESVSANDTNMHAFRFIPGTMWRISVVGDHDTNLDFDVYRVVFGPNKKVSRYVLVRSD